jgi:hypothetical protein
MGAATSKEAEPTGGHGPVRVFVMAPQAGIKTSNCRIVNDMKTPDMRPQIVHRDFARRLGLSLLALSALSACQTTRIAFKKPLETSAAARFDKDNLTCLSYADQIVQNEAPGGTADSGSWATDLGAEIGMGLSARTRHAAAYNKCMKAKGYQK